MLEGACRGNEREKTQGCHNVAEGSSISEEKGHREGESARHIQACQCSVEVYSAVTMVVLGSIIPVGDHVENGAKLAA